MLQALNCYCNRINQTQLQVSLVPQTAAAQFWPQQNNTLDTSHPCSKYLFAAKSAFGPALAPKLVTLDYGHHPALIPLLSHGTLLSSNNISSPDRARETTKVRDNHTTADGCTTETDQTQGTPPLILIEIRDLKFTDTIIEQTQTFIVTTFQNPDFA